MEQKQSENIISNRTALLKVYKCMHAFNCGENVRTPHGFTRVWLSPSKEPHQDIDRAVLITVHDESTFRALVRPLPQWHALQIATSTAHLGRVALI